MSASDEDFPPCEVNKLPFELLKMLVSSKGEAPMPTISFAPMIGILVWTAFIVGVWWFVDEVLLKNGRNR